MGKLDGKVAYVTGGGRGIGRAVCLKLASDGARIVVNDLDAEPANAVVGEIKAMGGEAIAMPGSVSAPSFGDDFIAAGIDAFGGVDIIVNNAGFTWDAMIQNMSDEQFDTIIDVHMRAPFRILRAASRFIIPAAKAEAANGQPVIRKVVNISSVSGTHGNPGQVNYSSAKAGIAGMTRTLAREWGRYNVNVNCVAFGLISTRLNEVAKEAKQIEVDGNRVSIGLPPKVRAGFEAMIPMGRLGTVEEGAGSVWLFCVPESNYVSGQTLVVAGGT